jgi:phage tail tape-measure protein
MYKSMIAMMAGAAALTACTSTSDDTLESAGTGAVAGAAVGAGAGALIGGLSPIEGALIGAAAGGLIGAVWADRDADGRADGYYYNGQYYQGLPPAQPAYQQEPARTGERG